jgi:hypothetical protein
VSLCLHDALDRLLVLEEDNVGVTAVVVADQDSAEDSVLLSYKRFSNSSEVLSSVSSATP